MASLDGCLGCPCRLSLWRREVMCPASHADAPVQQDGKVRSEPAMTQFLPGAHLPAPFIWLITFAHVAPSSSPRCLTSGSSNAMYGTCFGKSIRHQPTSPRPSSGCGGCTIAFLPLV